MSRRPLALVAVPAAVAAACPLAVAAAADGGALDRSGSRLLAEGTRSRVCLTLVEPRNDLRLRRCLREAAEGRIRTAYVDGQCEFGTRLFGIAPPGTNRVNLGNVPRGERTITVKLRALRIPRRVQHSGGVAFVVRRSLAGTSGITLTAYDARGRRLVQRTLGTYPIAGCEAPRPTP